MTSDEKWEDAESCCLGMPCGVLTCKYNVNGRATCGDYSEDHCKERLFHDLTDSKRKFVSHDEDGNEVIQNLGTGEEKVIPLEPWITDKDIVDFNYGLITPVKEG